MIDLAKVLAPLHPVEHAGWRTRGGSSFAPTGQVLHHTASSISSGDVGSLNVVLNGRTDVPPPLCNVLWSRSGVPHLIAAGRANHAGADSSIALAEMTAGRVNASTKTAAARGLRDDTTGNRLAFGHEIENNGTYEPWAPVLVEAVCHGCALISAAMGWTSGHTTLHKLITARKTDPWGTTDWWSKIDGYLNQLTAPKPSLTLWQVGVDIMQPTGPDSALHLSPAQLADLRNRYTVTIVPHARPSVVT